MNPSVLCSGSCRDLLRLFKEALAAVVFPYRCLVCGSLYRPVHHPLGDGGTGGHDGDPSPEVLFARVCERFVCPACAAEVMPAASPMCLVCGIVFKSRQGRDHICGRCLKRSRHFEAARAFGLYHGPLMALVHQFKYRGRSRLGAPLGRLMFAVFAKHFGHRRPDLVLPVPLHRRQFRRRGFNQAYLLASGWSKAAADSGADAPEIERSLLVRLRATAPQAGLGRKKRMENIRHAFGVTDGNMIDGRNILLVDDVMTTGATLDECARVLKLAGAARVDCLTLARAV